MRTKSRPLTRSIVAVAIVALVAVVCSGTATASGTSTTADDEVAFHQLVNQARSRVGLSALTRDTLADGVARRWTGRMIEASRLSHNPNLGSEVSAQVTTQWTRLGENVGVGERVDQLHEAFMSSTGHRANILGDFNRVGIGAVRADGRLWVTLVFIKGPAIAAPTQTAAISFAPFADSASFTRQQYLDILGRPADPAGLAYWQRLLDSGKLTTGDLGATLLGSPEVAGTVAPTVRLYFAAFHRIPDAVGAGYWVGQVRDGMSLVDVARSFASSSEFTSTTGATSSQDFVSLLYRNVLQREPDSAGLTYWSTTLDRGQLDRGQLLYQFSESTEFTYAVRFGVLTSMAYVSVLQRGADEPGFVYWVDQFWRGAPASMLVGSFFKSTEYQGRF